jgi:tetrahydromethanopterin S-methyltransferase subunit G
MNLQRLIKFELEARQRLIIIEGRLEDAMKRLEEIEEKYLYYDPLLSTREVSERYGINVMVIGTARKKGEIVPDKSEYDQKFYYFKSTIDRWISKRLNKIERKTFKIKKT